MTSNQTKKIIANNIKEARKVSRLTQLEVADMADINVNYYAKIERGEAIPSLMTLEKILITLKIKSSKILPF